MNISQRGSGGKSLIESMFKASKEVSSSNGIVESLRIPTAYDSMKPVDTNNLGAAASIKKANIPQDQQKMLQDMFGSSQRDLQESTSALPNVSSSGSIKFDFVKSSTERLIDSVEMLKDTKEYFNALQSMLSLYALGYLDDVVLSKISRDDLDELKGILREFKSIIDKY